MTLSSSKFLWWIAAAVFGAAAISIGSLFWLDAHTPKRNRYLIPVGFAGWLCVSYKIPGAASLPIEDGFRVIRFSATGVVETSDEGLPGKYKDELYYYAPEGRLESLGEGEMGGGHTEAKVEIPDQYTMKFWVSRDAKADHSKYVENKPQGCGVFPGYPT
jgi:hypothetical protein